MTVAEFIDFVNRHRYHSAFIHFTSSENLPLIRQHGLLSTQERSRRGIAAPITGGNQWSMDADSLAGMDKYVHLGFRKGHSMEFHARKKFVPIHLEVIPEILNIAEAKITLDVSNKAGVVPLTVADGLNAIDRGAIYDWNDNKDPAAIERFKSVQKYEILIPDQIPTSYIRNL